MNDMLYWTTKILLIVGGLNWLLFAFGYNLVDMIFGALKPIDMIIYVLVGLAALYKLAMIFMKK